MAFVNFISVFSEPGHLQIVCTVTLISKTHAPRYLPSNMFFRLFIRSVHVVWENGTGTDLQIRPLKTSWRLFSRDVRTFLNRSVDISFKDDVTVLLLLGASNKNTPRTIGTYSSTMSP